MRATLIALTTLTTLLGSAQTGTHVHIVGNTYIRFKPVPDRDTYLVLSGPNSTAFHFNPANNGGVISESERNLVRWYIHSAAPTELFTLTTPLADHSGRYIPLIWSKTSGTHADLVLDFATYAWNSDPTLNDQDAWNNSLYMPSGVAHMDRMYAPTGNNSAHVVDRFWRIDLAGDFPAASMAEIRFNYTADDAALNGGNSAGFANNLIAQRYNNVAHAWGDQLPTSIHIGQSVIVSDLRGDAFRQGNTTYRNWTLASGGSPLPIELLQFHGSCSGERGELFWVTASERNNHHFSVQQSSDNKEWFEIARVPAVGNSSVHSAYHYMVPGDAGPQYYRLLQVDLDGATTVLPTVVLDCSADGLELIRAWDDHSHINLELRSGSATSCTLALFDAQGKIVRMHAPRSVLSGQTTLQVDRSGLAPCIYSIRLQAGPRTLATRVAVR